MSSPIANPPNLALRSALLGLALTATLTPVVWAGPGSWTPLGLDGGSVSAIAPSPSFPLALYVGTAQSGAFRTTDGGRSWSPASSGLATGSTFAPVYTLAVDPRNPESVYLGSYGKAFRTRDGGRTWVATAPLASASISHVVLALSFDPLNPDIVYAGTAGGVYRTRNGGRTWTPRRTGLTNNAVRALGFAADGSFYAGLQTGFVYRSVDSGGRWRKTNASPLPSIVSLGFDPRSPSSVFAGTVDGLFLSHNFGRSWSQVAAPLLTGSVLSVSFQSATERFYAANTTGVFVSVDRGSSWSRTPGPLGAPLVECFAVGREALFAGTFDPSTSGELRRSDDGGSRWQSATHGISLLTPLALAFDAVDLRLLYTTAGRAGLFRSRNAGVTWSRLDLGTGDLRIEVSALTIEPASPHPLFVGGSTGADLLRSDDGGTTWVSVPSDAPGADFAVLRPDPRVPLGLWAGGFGTVLHSADGGAHWDRVALQEGVFPWIDDIEVDPGDPAIVTFVGTQLTGVHPVVYRPLVVRTEDGGSSWHDLTPIGVPFGAISRFASDRAAPGTFYAVANTQLLRSTDSGASWQTILDRGGYVGGLLATPEAIYVGLSGSVLRSTDQGAHWTPIRAGLGPRSVTQLWSDPHDGRHFFAATLNGGLYEYTAPH